MPTLRPDELHRPALPGVAPRTVRLVVLDHRSPKPDDTEETSAAVRSAIAETLQRSSVVVRSDSPNDLSVIIAHPKQAPDGFSPEACVEMTGRLTHPGGSFAQASASRCFEWKHWLGFSLGGDSSKTFQPAINDMLQQLDVQLNKLPPSKPQQDSSIPPPARHALASFERSRLDA